MSLFALKHTMIVHVYINIVCMSPRQNYRIMLPKQSISLYIIMLQFLCENAYFMTLKYAHNYVNEKKIIKKAVKNGQKKTVAGAQYLTFSREITSQN